MNVQQFNDLFDGDYDNVMNRVIEYVSYIGGGNNSGAGVDDNIDDNNNNKNDVDEDNESF